MYKRENKTVFIFERIKMSGKKNKDNPKAVQKSSRKIITTR